MSYTVAEAYTRISSDFLNDPNQTDFTDAKIARALRAALSQCIEEYAQNGGDRLQRRGTGTTAAGVLDLSAVDISSIQGVSEVRGTSEYNITPKSGRSIIQLSAAVPVAYYYTPAFVLSATGSEPLIGDGATEEPGAWDGMAEWICVRAAVTLRVQRGENPPPGLVLLETNARAGVLDSKVTPSSFSLPRIGSNRSLYAWTWRPSTRELLVTVQ